MTSNDVSSYWKNTAHEALASAEALEKASRFDHALFFCHLAIEKLLKGIVYKKTNEHPLPIHNLVKLAQQTNLPFTNEQRAALEEITTWNIQARYDDVKRDFFHKATPAFTKLWFSTVKELFVWLLQQY